MLNVGYKGRTILLTQDQPLGSVGGRVIQLPAPTLRVNRRWLVPVDFIGRALASVYDSKITLRRPSRLVIVGDVRVPRVQVRYDAATAATGRITVDATPKVASTIVQDGDQLLMKFDADAIDLVTPGAQFSGAAQGLIGTVRLADPVTLAFTIGPGSGVQSRHADVRYLDATDDRHRVGHTAPQPARALPPAAPRSQRVDLRRIDCGHPHHRHRSRSRRRR
jgi:hypothetical protein